MTDREMLELAAKACGIDPKWDGLSWQWNPLTDDGDCARMEAQLGISLIWYNPCIFSAVNTYSTVEMFTNHNNDRNAARRMASTRIAAGIGRGMK